jgi:hypothetical protein
MPDHIFQPIHFKGSGMTPRIMHPAARPGTKNDYARKDQQQFTQPNRPIDSNPQGRDSMLLQNVGIHLQYCARATIFNILLKSNK